MSRIPSTTIFRIKKYRSVHIFRFGSRIIPTRVNYKSQTRHATDPFYHQRHARSVCFVSCWLLYYKPQKYVAVNTDVLTLQLCAWEEEEEAISLVQGWPN
jgi:hypothetical protein